VRGSSLDNAAVPFEVDEAQRFDVMQPGGHFPMKVCCLNVTAVFLTSSADTALVQSMQGFKLQRRPLRLGHGTVSCIPMLMSWLDWVI
jgi:hypothetical protein